MYQAGTCICILVRVVQFIVSQFLLQKMMYTMIQENAKRRWATKVQIRFQIELATLFHNNIHLLKPNQVVYRNS